MDRYLVDFLSVFANFSCVIVVLGTPSPNVPLIIGQQNYDRQLSPQKRRDFLLISGEQGFFSEPPLARNSRLPCLRPCSPEIHKKSRLFCRLAIWSHLPGIFHGSNRKLHLLIGEINVTGTFHSTYFIFEKVMQP